MSTYTVIQKYGPTNRASLFLLCYIGLLGL